MPVPKQRTSKSKRDMRSSCKALRKPNFSKCSHCDSPKLPHRVCLKCGYYNDKKIITVEEV